MSQLPLGLVAWRISGQWQAKESENPTPDKDTFTNGTRFNIKREALDRL